MKRKINEENYNEQIEIGVTQDKFQAKAIVNMLRKEGIDAYSDGNSVFILAERDSNDPHYVDDIKQYAIEKFNEFCGDSKQPMKLACSKQKNMKITESKLKSLIKESVRKALLESDTVDTSHVDREREWAQLVNSEKAFIEELVTFLNRNGIKSAHLGKNPSGWPCVAIDSDEYHKSNADSMAEAYGKRHGKKRMRVQSYPATTYFVFE